MPPLAPFSHPTRRARLSSHPKTILNRTYESNKGPLERALSRDNATFRKAKSKHLASFHSSQQWNRLSESDCEGAEQEIIDSLIAIRDARKRGHEMEWRHKVEVGEDEDDEEMARRQDVDGGGKDDSRSVDEKEAGVCIGEWVDEDKHEEWGEKGSDDDHHDDDHDDDDDDDGGWVDEENSDECMDEVATNGRVGPDRRLAHSISEIKRLWGEGY